MKMADCFAAAFAVAKGIRKDWIFVEDGSIYNEKDLEEISQIYDQENLLAEEDFLLVSDDGSIGLLMAGEDEPQWYFVSPEFAVVNILHEDLEKYMDNSSGKRPKFCGNCGAPLTGGNFCSSCGAKV